MAVVTSGHDLAAVAFISCVALDTANLRRIMNGIDLNCTKINGDSLKGSSINGTVPKIEL